MTYTSHLYETHAPLYNMHFGDVSGAGVTGTPPRIVIFFVVHGGSVMRLKEMCPRTKILDSIVYT